MGFVGPCSVSQDGGSLGGIRELHTKDMHTFFRQHINMSGKLTFPDCPPLTGQDPVPALWYVSEKRSRPSSAQSFHQGETRID